MRSVNSILYDMSDNVLDEIREQQKAKPTREQWAKWIAMRSKAKSGWPTMKSAQD